MEHRQRSGSTTFVQRAARYNLRANPETFVQVGRERRAVRARVATPDERARLWALALAVYSGYDGYEARTDREIPVVALEPR